LENKFELGGITKGYFNRHHWKGQNLNKIKGICLLLWGGLPSVTVVWSEREIKKIKSTIYFVKE